jgi:hypothetical protein
MRGAGLYFASSSRYITAPYCVKVPYSIYCVIFITIGAFMFVNMIVGVPRSEYSPESPPSTSILERAHQSHRLRVFS